MATVATTHDCTNTDFLLLFPAHAGAGADCWFLMSSQYHKPCVGDRVLALRQDAWESGESGEEGGEGDQTPYEAVVLEEHLNDNSFTLKFSDPRFLTDPVKTRVG